MATVFVKSDCSFFLNGERQLLIEDLSYDIQKTFEELKTLDDPYSKFREIIDEGSGDISFPLSDRDDGYGPLELGSYVLGHNDWDTTLNEPTLTKDDLTIGSDGNMKRYVMDRQNDASGAAATIVQGGATETLTYQAKGEKIEKIGLNLSNTASLGAGTRLQVTGTASGESAWIKYADLADGEKIYDLWNTGETAAATITTYSGTHDAQVDDTLTLTLVDVAGTCDVEGTGTNPWYMMRMYNANHLIIEIHHFIDGGTSYYKHVLKRVWIDSASVTLDHRKAARISIKFTFEEVVGPTLVP